MTYLFAILAFVLLLPAVATRLVFLIPGRLGWIPYLGGVFNEFFVKRLHPSREAVECGIALAGLVAWRLAGVGWAWIWAGALGLLALEYYVRRVERRLLTDTHTPVDRLGATSGLESTSGLARGYPTPSTHPELTVNVVGPFVERWPAYRLGTLVTGCRLRLRLLAGNHTNVPTQTGIRLRVEAPGGLRGGGEAETLLPRLSPGQVHEVIREWDVIGESGPGAIRFTLEWGHLRRTVVLGFGGCVPADRARIERADITRYPGAARSAFAWRGDMDLYDESTLQSIEGLEAAFGLAARYRMPQTMYLSTRLSLDQATSEAWAAHYGIDRGAGQIPRFVEWMRANVDLRHASAYPFRTDKRFVVELGNHGHLHFGTHTSGAPENGWKLKARMGAGVYAWLGADRSPLAEQRDNAMEARRWMERCFQFSPRSWAMPNRTNDRSTAAAMEAAGCEVLSGSDTTPRSNVIKQPPPHHPPGTRAVELTNRYPGDPRHVYHWAMVMFWLHRSQRRGIPMVFMCHQHMRQFDGHACTRFTESILRQALGGFHGDLHINTMFGMGKYWREALSPETRRIRVTVAGDRVTVENGSDAEFADVPVDLVLAGGGRATLLVDLPARSRVTLKWPGSGVVGTETVAGA